jgi:putative two-component system response regulator
VAQHDPVGDRPTLLLIDDCVEQRDLYELALAPDFNILAATRGMDGIALAAANHPDAIVLDVVMPGLSGWETCTRLKCAAATADVPVVLLTGTNDVDLSDHAMAVGAFAVLTKPCPIDRLKSVVLMALDLAPSDQTLLRKTT